MTRLFLAFVLATSVPTRVYTSKVAPLVSRALETETLPKARFSLPFTDKVPRPTSKKDSFAQITGRRKSHTTALEGVDFDKEYLVPITVGGQNFKVIVDTGSSDTWLPEIGFQCLNLTSYPEPESVCNFGTSGFNPRKSPTFEVIHDKNFNITYGGGNFVLGTVATEKITVGGMTVKKQEIGVGTHVAWFGDGVSTGLMGLALPDLTSVYNGTNPDNDSVVTDHDIYNPLFFTALTEGVVSEPYFSISLNRGTVAAETNSTQDLNLGCLALGGIVDVPVTTTTVTVPIQGFTATGSDETGYFWYTIDIDTYNFPGAPNVSGAALTPFLDSGTTFMYLPTEIADAYNAAIDPPAQLSDCFGGYAMPCNATVPEFSITIAGKAFTVDSKDILFPTGVTLNGTDWCFSGIQDGGFAPPVPIDNQTIYVLGDAFLHNVVATYNVKTPSLTITQRELY